MNTKDHSEEYGRLERIRAYAGLNWKELKERIGIRTQQTFTDIKKGRHGISPKLANAILAAFPEINREWLIFGTGDMLDGVPANGLPLLGSGGERVAGADLRAFFPEAVAVARVEDAGAGLPMGAFVALARTDGPESLFPGTDCMVFAKGVSLIRRVSGCAGGVLTLCSTNEETYPDGRQVYAPVSIAADDISGLYRVCGYLVTPKTSLG